MTASAFKAGCCIPRLRPAEKISDDRMGAWRSGQQSAAQRPPPSHTPVAFSALGYFVLMPNVRGSFAEGEAFTAANRKDFGYGDLRDLLARGRRRNKEISRRSQSHWHHRHRSYGGFMSMFAITQTHRFHAAVAEAGISNWKSYYGENSIDQWMIPYFGASVYDDPAVYARSSPINFIRNARTPTLLLLVIAMESAPLLSLLKCGVCSAYHACSGGAGGVSK